jgi:hypothetical protein
MTYSVNDIVGKTLVAKKRVPVKASPLDSAPILRYIEAGKPVGVVYSYLEPKTGRSQLYWMFEEDFFGDVTYYYIPHSVGAFDKEVLESQFPKPPTTLADTAKNALFGIAGIWAGVQIIKSIIDKK